MITNIYNKIIYQDDHLLIIDKPSGLRVLPDGYNQELPNLVGFLMKKFGKVFTVHRLDKDTSGLILFALDQSTHKELNTQFETRKVQKKYISICHNIPEWNHLSFKVKILVNGDRRHRTIVKPSGKQSHTDFFVIKKELKQNYSVILCALHTGYTHQIRCHLSYLGFPLFGDPLYKNYLNPKQELKPCPINRTALHAFKLVFYHPVLKERIQFCSPTPSDMINLIK